MKKTQTQPAANTVGELELKLEYSLDGSIFIMQDEMPIAAIQANDDNGEVILKEDEETAKEIVKRFNAFPILEEEVKNLNSNLQKEWDATEQLQEQNKVLLEALKEMVTTLDPLLTNPVHDNLMDKAKSIINRINQ